MSNSLICHEISCYTLPLLLTTSPSYYKQILSIEQYKIKPLHTCLYTYTSSSSLQTLRRKRAHHWGWSYIHFDELCLLTCIVLLIINFDAMTKDYNRSNISVKWTLCYNERCEMDARKLLMRGLLMRGLSMSGLSKCGLSRCGFQCVDDRFPAASVV